MVRLNKHEINWIANEFKANRSISEIATDTGMSSQNVKRALCEAGLMSVSWYKTADEQAMLEYLKLMGITNLTKLKETI